MRANGYAPLFALGDAVRRIVKRGEDTAQSDVDLLVIGTVSGRVLANATSAIQSSMGREINTVRCTPEEFAQRGRQGDPFVVSVLPQPKVFVKGDEDLLRAPAA